MNLKEQFNGIQHIGIPTNDLVHFLPFWENGVKFFTIVASLDRPVGVLTTSVT